jgi:hypothetical protein
VYLRITDRKKEMTVRTIDFQSRLLGTTKWKFFDLYLIL